MFAHDANTYGGNSGGPVILDKWIEIAEGTQESYSKAAVGVHVSGPRPRLDIQDNCATMIDRKLGGSNETE